jgi:hypothetical protein
MAAGAAAEQPFTIHEDVRTEETEMVDEENPLVVTEDGFAMGTEEAQGDIDEAEEDEEEDEEQDEDEEDEEYESSDDEHVDRSVLADMQKLVEDFPSFAKKYRLIKRIGEGWFHRLPQPLGQWLTMLLQGPSRPSTRPRTSSTTTTTTTGKTRLRQQNGHRHPSAAIMTTLALLVAQTATSL